MSLPIFPEKWAGLPRFALDLDGFDVVEDEHQHAAFPNPDLSNPPAAPLLLHWYSPRRAVRLPRRRPSKANTTNARTSVRGRPHIGTKPSREAGLIRHAMSSTPHTEWSNFCKPWRRGIVCSAPSGPAISGVFLNSSPAAVSLPLPDGLTWQTPHALPVFCANSGLAAAVPAVPPMMTLTSARVATAEPIPSRVDLDDIAIPSISSVSKIARKRLPLKSECPVDLSQQLYKNNWRGRFSCERLSPARQPATIGEAVLAHFSIGVTLIDIVDDT